ncbi:M20 metallopeptidase family protein [Clostridium grantii]|uniref:Peptidase dimerisation domain-containing protein n=1 Tax=Clostridium grantii DSM 8605 TaxID=1121316 RepID=A0A1M5UCQ5_9CLOT|nr:amidohydrolase [Clostridium grantii]SHH60747.1 Peptidase dimerisation domain-containing protein [Clostridium grantii DSM 8605]
MADKLLEEAYKIKDELIKIRRDIHAHPETGLKEVRTSTLVANKLKNLGLDVQTNVGITGVSALLKGNHPGKTVLLRADMDCLEMDELNNVAYKSTFPGKMHACGHDAHVTWLLGTAMLLSNMKENIHGNIKFCFQPAEESHGGAERMIEAGILDNPKVDAAIGAHIWPSIESGKIGIKYGSMMAAPDMFKLIIKGKGGHGAMPHTTIDPINIANQIYNGFQTIVSRMTNPVEPVVITVGMFNSGSAHNIIPEEAELVGTVRTLTTEKRNQVPEQMENVIKGITSIYGAEYEFIYDRYYPPVINDNKMTDIIKLGASQIIGENNVEIISVPSMGGEDFSYFCEKIPSAFFNIGTYNKDKNIIHPLHSPYFDIDEEVLFKASAVMANCALTYLSKENLI